MNKFKKVTLRIYESLYIQQGLHRRPLNKKFLIMITSTWVQYKILLWTRTLHYGSIIAL